MTLWLSAEEDAALTAASGDRRNVARYMRASGLAMSQIEDSLSLEPDEAVRRIREIIAALL